MCNRYTTLLIFGKPELSLAQLIYGLWLQEVINYQLLNLYLALCIPFRGLNAALLKLVFTLGSDSGTHEPDRLLKVLNALNKMRCRSNQMFNSTLWRVEESQGLIEDGEDVADPTKQKEVANLKAWVVYMECKNASMSPKPHSSRVMHDRSSGSIPVCDLRLKICCWSPMPETDQSLQNPDQAITLLGVLGIIHLYPEWAFQGICF